MERGTGAVTDTIPFTGSPRLRSRDLSVRLDTPQFEWFSLSGWAFWGHDFDFEEWSPATILFGGSELSIRPTNRLRLSATYELQQYYRHSDGRLVSSLQLPRLKLEYQLSRAIFLRLVGRYDALAINPLRDDTRTGGAILLRDPATGIPVRTGTVRDNSFRLESLFSFQPSPGTVGFLGYGSLMEEPQAFRFRGLQRRSDGFFLKLSYLWRC